MMTLIREDEVVECLWWWWWIERGSSGLLGWQPDTYFAMQFSPSLFADAVIEREGCDHPQFLIIKEPESLLLLGWCCSTPSETAPTERYFDRGDHYHHNIKIIIAIIMKPDVPKAEQGPGPDRCVLGIWETRRTWWWKYSNVSRGPQMTFQMFRYNVCPNLISHPYQEYFLIFSIYADQTELKTFDIQEQNL